MVTKINKNIKLSTCKILLCLPLILLASNLVAMEQKECDKIETSDKDKQSKNKKLQAIIKNIIIAELGLSYELSSQIDEAKLPCDHNSYDYFEKPKEIFYDCRGLFELGANSKEIENLSNSYSRNIKEVIIENTGKFLVVEHLVYAPNILDKFSIKIITTENGSIFKDFKDLTYGSEIIGKNKKFLKLVWKRDDNGKTIKSFVDLETGYEAKKLEYLV